ncbi:MAG: hypothetical protein KJ601_03940 [Nanoarchaeota archaeon]|nr:hypothetical protein [Nanoarchaeota archaeon]
MSILGPQFLVKHIGTFAYVLSAVILVIFSDAINRYIVFPVADGVKGKAHKHLKKHGNWGKYISEAAATLIFILYCWFGSVILATYIIAPILNRARDFLILVLLGIFLLVSYVINFQRKRFLKV